MSVRVSVHQPAPDGHAGRDPLTGRFDDPVAVFANTGRARETLAARAGGDGICSTSRARIVTARRR